MKFKILILTIVAFSCFGQSGKYDITIEQGSTWNRQIVLLDADLDTLSIEGYAVRMHIRKTVASSDTILTATTDNGYIEVSESMTGTFEITIPHTRTDDLSFRTAYYDIEICKNSTFVTRVLMGRVLLSREVTR